MAYSAIAIANKFIELAVNEERLVSHMKLQKLVYIAHGWCLATTNKPLIKSLIQAWQYGPIIPELYTRLQKYGKLPIIDKVKIIQEIIPDKDGGTFFKAYSPQIKEQDELNRAIVEKVWDEYKNFSTYQLAEIANRNGTPWSKTEPGKNISNKLIQEYYLKILRENGKTSLTNNDA